MAPSGGVGTGRGWASEGASADGVGVHVSGLGRARSHTWGLSLRPPAFLPGPRLRCAPPLPALAPARSLESQAGRDVGRLWRRPRPHRGSPKCSPRRVVRVRASEAVQAALDAAQGLLWLAPICSWWSPPWGRGGGSLASPPHRPHESPRSCCELQAASSDPRIPAKTHVLFQEPWGPLRVPTALCRPLCPNHRSAPAVPLVCPSSHQAAA